MLPTYILYYFTIQGLGEPVRLLLSYGKIEFEDVRISDDDWPSLKPSMPMGMMPVLKIGDKTIHQSSSISRYLGHQFGLAGANDWENLEIDMAVDSMHDVRTKASEAFYETDEALKATKYEALAETIPFILGKLDDLAKANNGHMALGKLTWADIFFAGIYDYLVKITGIDIGAKYSNLKAVVDTVREIPEIKAWREKAPKSDW